MTGISSVSDPPATGGALIDELAAAVLPLGPREAAELLAEGTKFERRIKPTDDAALGAFRGVWARFFKGVSPNFLCLPSCPWCSWWFQSGSR